MGVRRVFFRLPTAPDEWRQYSPSPRGGAGAGRGGCTPHGGGRGGGGGGGGGWGGRPPGRAEGGRRAAGAHAPTGRRRVQDVCMALKRTDIGCVAHYVTMQKAEAKKYGCAARCVSRDKNEAACASTCGSTPAPPFANDPMAIPQ